MLCVSAYMCCNPSRSLRISSGFTHYIISVFRRFAARSGPVPVMYSENTQTFRCVSFHLNILKADPTVQDLIARKNVLWIFSASLAPCWWGEFWERMVTNVKDLLTLQGQNMFSVWRAGNESNRNRECHLCKTT